ncbi:MAG: helicase-exonuclease AddAB subunit AddA [Lachnospiraceae bacterium]|nr:helicase-exonuclease AddAB subunit AddA [Lachnospiraceae bacterium]
MNYTDEQREVIDTRDTDILVSAAAGSGKTAVLTERIVSLLSDEKHPVDIDRFLIVTFTRAAAAEMRERIAKAISKKCADNPGNRHMERQSALINNAQITTIDSFCLFVVKNNFSDIDLDPGFRILDEAERSLLLTDCLDELLEEMYSQGSEKFLRFMDSYCSGVSDDYARKLILMFLQSALSDPDPEGWIENAAADMAPAAYAEIDAGAWYAWGCKKADGMIAELKAAAMQAEDICRSCGNLPASYSSCASYLVTHADMLSEHRDYEGRRHILSAISVPRLAGKKDGADPEGLAAAKLKIDEAKSVLKTLTSLYAMDEEQLAASAQLLKDNAEVLKGLCLELKRRFDESKREKAVVDFNDMEHFALKILLDDNKAPSRAAMEYRDYFEYIFIDEYQDSNYVQEYILKSIARSDNYFCVGDVKQSIYSFRQARPELFMEKYRQYAKGEGGKNIDLNRNFRSRREVIDFVNLVFEVIMREDTAGMDYDDDARLYVGADYYPEAEGEEYKTEIDVLLTEETDDAEEEDTAADDEEEEEGGSREELECRMVAERIRELKAEGFKVYDKEQQCLRPMRYSDIVLLAASVKPYEKALRNTFTQYDIPLYLSASTGYFGAIEVKGLVAALKVIDNPGQDKPLHYVLVGFLELLDEDEMTLIRSEGDGKSLYGDLKAYAGKEDETAGKIKTFFEWLKRYRDYARYMKVRELISLLLSESGYLDRMSAMPGGALRRANLMLLLERAADYEQTTYRGLFHFVRYLALLKKQETDSGEASVPDASADMVQCMTIHKSKGLEFPVVICMGFYRRFNKRGSAEPVITDAALGMGMDAIDPAKRTKFPGIKRQYLSEKKKCDDMAEQMRKLYVALTRAEEKLIITDVRGQRRNTEKAEAGSFAIRRADSFNTLIFTALNDKGIAERYIRYAKNESETVKAGRELKRAFDERDRLLKGQYEVDGKLKEDILSGLEARYSHPALKGLYTKTSVSELKHAAYEDEEAKPVFETDIKSAYVPAFASEEEKSSGTLRGSAYHRILELLDYMSIRENNVAEGIKQNIERERASGRLSAEYAALIHPEAIERFLAHEESRAIKRAAEEGRLWREQPFFMAVSAKELNADFPEDENVLIQGVIDAFWQEDDKLVLLDYKTDRVDKGEELVKRYSLQLELYARALKRIRGLEVKKRLIYSFSLDRFISL